MSLGGNLMQTANVSLCWARALCPVRVCNVLGSSPADLFLTAHSDWESGLST